ncbi:class A sortase [Enterococcus sp. 669A]|uniref:Class A sortase n=1 Tax=Candidatus Enterococcus moelleringii TaxID=2815325 RepID=A0ABS3L5G6_9ENTE|nr:class A sortase [Enterococcus sp. 669A]MBO1304852.1 class A sortase [Enterococcus sp. 669A]
MKRKRKKRNWLINIFLLLLLLVGLALIFNNQIKNFLIQYNGDRYAVANMSKEDIDQNMQEDMPFDFDAVIPASTEAVMRAQLSNKRLPVIGGIAIPSVAINLPIFKGLSNEALLFGAGTLEPEQVMGEGNYGLASHRAAEAGLLFTPLDNIQEGDKIYLTDLANIYTYRTALKVRVQPTEVKYLDVLPDRRQVTLVTCGEIDGITRIVVQGELEAVTPVEKATQQMQDAFNMEQRTY